MKCSCSFQPVSPSTAEVCVGWVWSVEGREIGNGMRTDHVQDQVSNSICSHVFIPNIVDIHSGSVHTQSYKRDMQSYKRNTELQWMR